jgi:predicted DNA-binding transcriptional regulator AlpA
VTEPASIVRFPVERRRPEPLLTLAELMLELGWSERWWRYRIAEGLPAVRWGGTLRFRMSEVQAWMEARQDAAS